MNDSKYKEIKRIIYPNLKDDEESADVNPYDDEEPYDPDYDNYIEEQEQLKDQLLEEE